MKDFEIGCLRWWIEKILFFMLEPKQCLYKRPGDQEENMDKTETASYNICYFQLD